MSKLSSAQTDKILIVDDDFRTRLLARSALEPAGYEICDVASGEAALAQLDSFIPDLILFDVLMPGMDGIQTCEKIRKHPTGADIPILMITGFDDPDTISNAYLAGATDFISKPIQWLVLPHRIAFIIRSSRTNRALKESEKQHKSFFEHNHSVMLVVDPEDGRILDANPAACSFYGWERDSLRQKTMVDLSTLTMEQLKVEMQKGLSFECNHCFFQHRLAGGALRDVEIFCSPVETAGKQLLILIVHDITERKLAEAALKESENRFRSIMDLTPTIAVQGYRLDGTTTYWNRSSELLYGYSREEAVGKNLLDLIIPPGMSDEVKGAMTWMAENEQPIPSGELELMRRDGSLVPVYSSHALLHPPGQEPELFCMDLDLSPLKQTEQELRQAKEAAEAASVAKSNFLSTMSHEIRTPLSALMGNIELLGETALIPQQQEYLQDCKAASRILLQVINDVLDYSKIEAGKVTLVNEPFSPAVLGKQLIRIFSPSAREKGLELSIQLPENLPEYVSGDELRISQIIANLLSNAIKFTHQGKVSLELSCKQLCLTPEPVEQFLEITVRDTGIGIPEDQQEMIFESFNQLENFGTRHFAGTGLGLTICKRLTDLMGGSIAITNTTDKGSAFHISLPAVTCAPPEQALQECTVAIIPRDILLADDDDLGRSVMTTLLKGQGHRVTAVGNGVQLLELLADNHFDIVLTDISMPDLDGINVARIIRSGERAGINPAIPIIAITAHAFSEDREQFLSAGINGFAAKPVDIEALQQQIEAICCEHTQQDAGPA